ncbi:MAG: zinc ribbon domain-containing protein [Terriglobia bacterium]
MHADLKTLMELQQVDQTCAQLTSRIESSPLEIQALKDQLDRFLHTLEERKGRLSASQKERRELDGDLEAIKLKIAKHKDQLYAVKTNEQYRAMLKEIDGEEANLRKTEDLILEKMVEAEQLDKLVLEASSHLDSEKARVESEIQKLGSISKEAEEERAGLLRRRQELAATLGDEILAHYERLRRGRNGIVMAEVRDGLCMGCHVRLRPQAYNEVRSSDILLTCETCNRILYYNGLPEVQEAGASAASTHGPSL